jgi:hypothetical protein
MNFVADLLWLFRSFYLRRSSIERTYVTYQRQHRSRHTPDETDFRRKGIASQDVDIHGSNALSR